MGAYSTSSSGTSIDVTSSSLTITNGGTTNINANSQPFKNLYASSNATSTTVTFSNISDGATVTVDYLKTTATDLAITFPNGTVISASSYCTISGTIATLSSTTSGRYTITILNINSVYKVFIIQDVA